MECKDCLIWQRRRDDIADGVLELVPKLARFLHEDEITKEWKELISSESKHLDSLFRHHISLMDTKCPEGRCILMQEALKN